jgi:hypothetical protein
MNFVMGLKQKISNLQLMVVITLQRLVVVAMDTQKLLKNSTMNTMKIFEYKENISYQQTIQQSLLIIKAYINNIFTF